MTEDAMRNIPQHVAIVMDGNGRWAKSKGKPRIFGHRAGVEALRKTVKAASASGVKVVSFFTFSTENWTRPELEVRALLTLFFNGLKTESKRLNEQNIKLRIIGDVSRFSDRIQQQIKNAEQLTENNTGLIVILAANYGGRWDVIQACRRIATEVEEGEVSPKEVDEDFFSKYLSLSDLPDVDLFIRTGGEERISNFFLWQTAYSELYFTRLYWPDFDADAFNQALTDYQSRERRYGSVVEVEE
jgi:undecaprenyl diphosphate synthase